MASTPSDMKGYTAIIHVHGMGSQRRLQELSRLVDSLDRYAHSRKDRTGFLFDIDLRLERSRTGGDAEVSYVRMLRQSAGGSGEVRRRVHRVYEAYWADLTAEEVSASEVARWLLAQVIVPLKALGTRWRLRARLRRAALHRLWPRMAVEAGTARNDLRKLLRLYDNFEGWDAWRAFPKGRGRDFQRYVERRGTGDDETRARLSSLARRWRFGYLGIELRNLGILATIGLSLLLAALGTIALLFRGLSWAFPLLQQTPLGSALPDLTYQTAAAGAGMLATALGLSGFFSAYLGDVKFWTTYQETSVKHRKRQEILQRTSDVFRHVLSDEHCERVVVAAHSLGTTIALDTLLALAREKRAQGRHDADPLRLDKIQHFITFGSPIDKVHYFFESHAGTSHRYNRVVEQLRGDIGTLPFARNGRPLIHWINFWDRADLISGALHTPTHRSYGFLTVDNVETRNLLLPGPGSAHTSYLDNADVVGTIFACAFDNAYNFALAPQHSLPGKRSPRPDYRAQRLGPGQTRPLVHGLHGLMLATPWLALAALLARALSHPVATLVLAVSAGVIAGLAMIIVVLTELKKTPCNPLLPPESATPPPSDPTPHR